MNSTETAVDTAHADAEIGAAQALERRLRRLTYVAAALGVMVVAAYAVNFSGPLSKNPESWGQFGDYVGGLLNPSFAFLALIALLGTFALQVRELRLTAHELKNSATALANQADTLRLQTFEATFFQLLRLHNEIVLSVQFLPKSLQGRACYQHFVDDFEGMLYNASQTSDFATATRNPTQVLALYQGFYRQHQSDLGHYFRLLYNIVKLIHRTPLIDKRFYTNLVRAQLSSAEVRLLFYNCLAPLGVQKFKPLVEEYGLLKTIPEERIPAPELFGLYAADAFGGAYPPGWGHA